MELYLITGFLGAGKTTFLKNFIKIFSDKKIHMVINEFGKEGVDGDLVREIGGVLSEINNGSIFCACKIDKFEDELDGIISQNPDVIIVEASGLSDPTNIRKILDTEKYKAIDYKGSICIVDAVRFSKVATTARVVPKQVKVSSLALINKVDLASNEQIEAVKQDIFTLNPVMSIKETSFGQIDKQWLSLLSADIDVEEVANIQDITLQKATIELKDNINLFALKGILNLIGEDTYRVKGFAKIDDEIYLINCVGGYIKVDKYDGAYSNVGKIIALAGTGMSLRKTLKEAQKIYGKYIEKIEYGG